MTVSSPKEGTALAAGSSFRLVATIAVGYPISSIGVRLWDVRSDYQFTWEFQSPSHPTRTSLNVELQVPPDAPPGSDYRIEVTAFPGTDLLTTPQLGVSVGYTVSVQIVPATR